MAGNSWAAIIFETNFDSHADWNTSDQYDGDECSVLGHSNSANLCNSSYYPTDWEAFRSVSCYPHAQPNVSISSLPSSLADHTTGTTSGKAMIEYDESYPACGAPWPGDGLLVKYFGGNTYPELYVQFWMRTQPSWQWKNSSNTCGVGEGQVKFFRAGYWAGLSSSQQNIFYIPDSHPQMFIDLAKPGGNDGIAHAYRCDPGDYYCTAVGSGSYEYNDYQYSTATYMDSNWHLIKYHLKLNSAGTKNGIMDIYQDGNLVYTHHDVLWKENGSTVPGFSHVMFGGNSCNQWSTQGVQWYSIDDIAISTTDIADNYIPGGGSSDTTAPAAPSGLSVY